MIYPRQTKRPVGWKQNDKGTDGRILIVNTYTESVDERLYLKAVAVAMDAGYAPVSCDLFAEWAVANRMDRPEPDGWDNVRDALADWENRQAEL